jgi:hypothetical protein
VLVERFKRTHDLIESWYDLIERVLTGVQYALSILGLSLYFKLISLELIADSFDPCKLFLNIIDDPKQLSHPILELWAPPF